MTVFIQLKNGRSIQISNFKHITYQNSSGNVVMIEEFDNFYLYDLLLTFVGEKSTVSLSSVDIEYVRFDS